jgi:hypothetical protein
MKKNSTLLGAASEGRWPMDVVVPMLRRVGQVAGAVYNEARKTSSAKFRMRRAVEGGRPIQPRGDCPIAPQPSGRSARRPHKAENSGQGDRLRGGSVARSESREPGRRCRPARRPTGFQALHGRFAWYAYPLKKAGPVPKNLPYREPKSRSFPIVQGR